MNDSDYIVRGKVQKGKTKNCDFKILDAENGFSYVFTTEYIDTLGDDESADMDQAIATISSIVLDYDTRKYISYLFINDTQQSKVKLLNITKDMLLKKIYKSTEMQKLLSYMVLQNTLRILRH